MNAHPHTPTLSVIDPRALAIRSVGYCRHPDESVIESRITRQVFNPSERLIESWDPRLWGTAPKPNLTTVYGLSGQSLLADSADAGWQLSLFNHAGSLDSFWDGRGSQRHCRYDDQQRAIAVSEQAADELPHVVDRLDYGGVGDLDARHNQCGRLIRHDDPAGSQTINEYGLAGSMLVESRRFLTELEPPDWPDDPDDRDELLEAQVFVTRHTFAASGEIHRQTDAMGNVRTLAHDVAGKLKETWLQLAGEGRQPQQLVSDIRYNAHDQIESEIAGNGVKTQAEYGADDGRLIRLVAAVGSQKLLQDLHYVYDAVGNITALEDKAQSVTWFNNQRIEPSNRYRYNSLSELVEAKGWEVANPSHGPALPDLLPTPLDPNQRRNYTQRFEYDAAGNLITRQHSGAPGFSMFTSTRSNRSLAQRDDGSLPGEPEIESGFDACGNQLELQRGQTMTWDIRNQLSRVTLVKRGDEPDDYEGYVYDRPGHRLRKVHFNQTSGRTGRTEVRYLPGLELHCQADGEERHVISIEAGRCSVRALHWPEGAHADQLRYSLCDHLGSSAMELDHEAGVLAQEHYYPFGGTACWAGKSALVVKYKTIRYSGKERDATGLYYYGFRYYAPWLQRWVSADPAGRVNGLNIFIFVSNHPINLKDVDGRIYEGKDDEWEKDVLLQAAILARGLEEFSVSSAEIIREGLNEIERVYTSGITAVESASIEYAEILKDFFGTEYENIGADVKVYDAFSRARELTKELMKFESSAKFVAVDHPDKNKVAWVYPDDPHNRIFLNISAVNAETVVPHLGHELTHFATIGVGTEDYFYLCDQQAQLSSQPLIQGKLTAKQMFAGVPEAFSKAFFIDGVAKYAKVSASGLDVDKAVALFNSRPDVRTMMASENADSIIYAAIGIHTRQSMGGMKNT
ncbi:RHS repeat domain-containing protein [Pseudomonas sp. GT1P32]